MKENLLLLFGGASSEHDVSIISGMQAKEYIDTNFYNVIPVYIGQDNKWYNVKKLHNIADFVGMNLKKFMEVTLLVGSNYLYKKDIFGYQKNIKIDCAMVVMHGINGEDGKIMALLELCGIPYTTSNVTESGVCLDKSIFKEYLNGININNVKGVSITQFNFDNNPEVVYEKLEKSLNYPMIVKPANQGSSIGIIVVHNRSQLEIAMQSGFKLGEKILVEQFLNDIKEINVAIVRDEQKLIVSELEQPIKSSEILSFDNKYLNSSNSMESISRIIPAEISEDKKQKIIDMATKVYIMLNLKGVVRFDFIISNDEVYLNEVNSIPGSLAYYLFKPKGISYNKLINILLKNAYLYDLNNLKKVHIFKSNILNGSNISIKK